MNMMLRASDEGPANVLRLRMCVVLANFAALFLSGAGKNTGIAASCAYRQLNQAPNETIIEYAERHAADHPGNAEAT